MGGASAGNRYRAPDPLMESTHDLPYIAAFALRKQWPSLSESDRQRFVAAFEKLSVMTYASRFKNVSAHTFKSGGPGRAGTGRSPPPAPVTRPRATGVTPD